MNRWMIAILLAATCGCQQTQEGASVTATNSAAAAKSEMKNPQVIIETSLGTVRAELWPDKAPLTVSNFLSYADDKYYDGLIFHRVIDGFMIQGGGFAPDMNQKVTRKAIKNEARLDVPNQRGTLAMARTPVVDSATSQFFINLVDNPRLNHRNEAEFGYCVFGQVTEGMDVVDRIGKVPTTVKAGQRDVPVETVTIKSIGRAK